MCPRPRPVGPAGAAAVTGLTGQVFRTGRDPPDRGRPSHGIKAGFNVRSGDATINALPMCFSNSTGRRAESLDLPELRFESSSPGPARPSRYELDFSTWINVSIEALGRAPRHPFGRVVG